MKERSMFWGLFFVTVGILLVVQTVLKIDLPIARILFGLVVIYIGVKMVLGSFGINLNGFRVDQIATSNEAVFTEVEFSAKKDATTLNKEFSTVFGNSKLDLTGLTADDYKHGFEVSTVFGKTEIKTPADLPLVVETNAVLGSVKVRGEKTGSMGNGVFKTPGFEADKPHVRIEANSVFGEIEIN
ncbi:MAG: hypothetical protein JNJ49_13780 [Bdellovibrionaceae bacterium]|nr:hypothetical protein [Pseudobdellovibrionaceae bacterium]